MMAANPATPVHQNDFEVILDDFKAQLTVKELDEFKFASLDGLRATIKLIQKEQEAKRRMQHMRRLEPFLRTMEQYGTVLEVFVNTSETLAFIWVCKRPSCLRRLQRLLIMGCLILETNNIHFRAQ